MFNKFIEAINKSNTITENGALSNNTSGSALLDYFSKAGTYRNRPIKEVFVDVSRMWQVDPLKALKIIFYNRMITRVTTGFVKSEKLQAGQGNKDEFRKGLVWVARYYPEILSKNLWIIPLVGCWKDLWHMQLIEELDRAEVLALIERGLHCDYNKALIAKYLPRIRSKSNVYNDRHLQLNAFAYDVIKYLGWSPMQYRKFKSSGKAHDFQRKMCKQMYDQVDFSTIPGKALHQMVNKRGRDNLTTFERHNIDARYLIWIEQQPVAKFTGYVYELMKVVNSQMSLVQKRTIDKQFEGVIALAKESGKITENMWCALDTSGSMLAPVADTTAYNICLSLGIYFSSLNEGAFKDQVIMFDQKSTVKKLSGSFSDKAIDLQTTTTAWGSTNFQSVIDEIVHIRMTQPSIPISEFPATLLVVSDMQFNPVDGNSETNYKRAMQKLSEVGLPNMRIVWWWVTGRASDFPSTLDDNNVIMIGGFDGAILSLLLSEEEVKGVGQADTVPGSSIGPYPTMLKALNQEVLQYIGV